MKSALITLITFLFVTSPSFAAQLPHEMFHLLKLDLILSARNFTMTSGFTCENQDPRIMRQRILTAVARAQQASFNESVGSVSTIRMEGTDDVGANYSVTLEIPQTKLSAISHPQLVRIELEMKDIGKIACSN